MCPIKAAAFFCFKNLCAVSYSYYDGNNQSNTEYNKILSAMRLLIRSFETDGICAMYIDDCIKS